MQDTVTRFANEKQNGLMLFEVSTGSGKKYQARKIIGKYIKGEILQNVPTIFYVSPLIKNDINYWILNNNLHLWKQITISSY